MELQRKCLSERLSCHSISSFSLNHPILNLEVKDQRDLKYMLPDYGVLTAQHTRRNKSAMWEDLSTKALEKTKLLHPYTCLAITESLMEGKKAPFRQWYRIHTCCIGKSEKVPFSIIQTDISKNALTWLHSTTSNIQKS